MQLKANKLQDDSESADILLLNSSQPAPRMTHLLLIMMGPDPKVGWLTGLEKRQQAQLTSNTSNSLRKPYMINIAKIKVITYII